jgi:hypothetical protein
MAESEKTLETLEEEIKLLKGELKQSIASVRDYLLNMELPSSEFSTILAALSTDGSGGGTQKISIDGSIASAKAPEKDEQEEKSTEEVTEEEILEPEDELVPEEDELLPEDDDILADDNMPDDEPDDDSGKKPAGHKEESYESDTEPESGLFPPEEELADDNTDVFDDVNDDARDDEKALPAQNYSDYSPEEEALMEYENTTAEYQPSTPKVNLLANLINWVAKAKREIGIDQMPMFLEVYGISGHLSPELKEAILHLTEITAEQSEEANRAEVWSQSMLSLHGILTGGDAPLHPVQIPLPEDSTETEEEEEEEIEAEKPEDTPVKLKLVFPSGDGQNKEFCVELTPDVENNAKAEKPVR